MTFGVDVTMETEGWDGTQAGKGVKAGKGVTEGGKNAGGGGGKRNVVVLVEAEAVEEEVVLVDRKGARGMAKRSAPVAAFDAPHF